MGDTELETGTLLAGQFRIRRKLGEGGMGSTYLAEQLEVERLVAIKVVHREVLSSLPDALERFKREGRALAQIDHPNVVKLYSVGETPLGLPFLAMEFVQGETLSAELARGPLPVGRAVEIARQVAEALSEVHGHSVIHRDLKPANIMLPKKAHAETTVKLVDFGIAKTPQASTQLTATGAFFGTPQYVSPEQARGLAIDERTDLYSLGLVLYEMLTGAGPFLGQSAFSILADHVNTPPEPPSRRRSGLPAELDNIVLRCLEKRPELRHSSAAELSRELGWMAAAASGDAPVRTLTAAVDARWSSVGGRDRTEALPVRESPRTPGPVSVTRAESSQHAWGPLLLKQIGSLCIAGLALLGVRACHGSSGISLSDRFGTVIARVARTTLRTADQPGAPQALAVSNDSLDGLIDSCLNLQTQLAHSSRARYVSWAGDGAEPRKSRNPLGLTSLYAPQTCVSAISSLSIAPTLDATFKHQANEFAAALRELQPLTVKAERYYTGHDYEDDEMRGGVQMHQPLLAAFARFFAADSPLRAATTQHIHRARSELLTRLQRSGAACEVSLLELLEAADGTMALASVPWQNVNAIDRTRLGEASRGLESVLDHAEEACGSVTDSLASGALRNGRSLLQQVKQLRRRLDQPRAFNAHEQRTLSDFAASMVDGSPARVAKETGSLFSSLNSTRMLRDAKIRALPPLYPPL